MFSTRSFRFFRSVARHRIAIISLAAVMTKPSFRVNLLLFSRPISISLSERSFISMQRLKTTRAGSIFRALPWWMWLSSIAAMRLFAEVIA